MALSLLAVSIVIASSIMIVLGLKLSSKTMSVIMKTLGCLLFAVYFYRLFSPCELDNVVGGVGIVTGAKLWFINILRWLTFASILVGCCFSWLKVKTLNNFLCFVVPFVVLLNTIFLRLNIVSILGEVNYSSAVSITFIFEQIVLAALSAYCLFKKIKDKDWSNIKNELKYLYICLPLIMLMVFPENMLLNFFGVADKTAQDFSLLHRLFIYISFIAPILISVFAKKKDYSVRNSIVVLLAIAGFMQYFYTFTFVTGVTGLPFHLCNTAILLIVVAFVFRSKSVFYFTYFVNVVGSLFAIVLPNCSTDIISIDCLHFWFNHWYAFFVPILGITLGIFKRPNFKMIRKAIYIFTAYLVFAALLNAWLGNYSPDVDYFFLYRNFIVGKFSFLHAIKEGFVISFTISDLVFKIYWVYDLMIYAAYILMIFLTWVIYAYCYKVGDHYAELLALNKMDVLDIKKLKKEMKGRKISEPYNLEGVDMIKISHFSKKYGNSKVFAVKDFSLEVQNGEIFGFLGHNGSGKSTTIKSLVGIQSITEGKIEICGYDISRQPLQAKMQMGYVSDNHAVYEHLTGREYINYIADLYNVNSKDREERIDKYAKMFNLQDAIDREIKGYSHGMKQKVMVISSLIHEPKVWVLDEPLTGLDPTSSFQIKECMKEHASKGNIVFFSSHVIEVVEKICTKICIIAHGELKGIYDVEKLKKDGISLEQLYMSFVEKSVIDADKVNDENVCLDADVSSTIGKESTVKKKTSVKKTKTSVEKQQGANPKKSRKKEVGNGDKA